MVALFHGKSYENRWFGATPISENHQMEDSRWIQQDLKHEQMVMSSLSLISPSKNEDFWGCKWIFRGFFWIKWRLLMNFDDRQTRFQSCVLATWSLEGSTRWWWFPKIGLPLLGGSSHESFLWVSSPQLCLWTTCPHKNPIEITRVGSPTYDSWDEPPSTYHPISQDLSTTIQRQRGTPGSWPTRFSELLCLVCIEYYCERPSPNNRINTSI